MTRVIGLLLLVPLGAFAVEAARSAPEFQLHARAWGQTLLLAGTAAVLALAFGFPTGLVLAHTRRRWPLALTLVPLLVPPALAAAAWMALKLPHPGAAACGAILAANLWPVVALLVLAGATRIPRAQLDAAVMFGSVRRVVWPALRPAALAGALVVFVLAAADFTVPATFAVPTVSHRIHESLSAFEFGAAATAALPLAVLAVALAMVLRRVEVLPQSGPTRAWLDGAPRGAAWTIAALAWSATAVLPAVLFARTVGSPATFVKVISANGASIAWTAGVAAVAAAIVVAWATLTPRRSRLEPLWLVTLALPGVVTALGALTLANRLGVQRPLVESGALMVFVLAARFAIVGWLPLRDTVERSQLEAAALSHWSVPRVWRRVLLPAALPRALAAGAIVFVLALGEIGPSVLLSPPGRQTVVQHLFNWMHYGYDDTVASLALAMLGAAWLLAWMGSYGRRVDHAPLAR